MSKIDKLLEALSSNRSDLGDMINDVKEFRKSIDKLLPKKIDFRNRFLWEEKMKTISNVLSTELAIRKQVDDSIKNEINIRTKIDDDGQDQNRDYYEAIAKAIDEGKITVEKPNQIQ